MLAIVLASLLFLREPRLQQLDERYLRWLLHNSRPTAARIPLSIVEISRGPDETLPSPLEFSLFTQAALEFKPIIVAFEPVLQWPASNPEQDQILLDQAMRIPKLLVAAELTSTPDPDTPAVDIAGFTNVTGRRGDLPAFSGVARQPDEDIRLLSTVGYANLPNDAADDIHVPLLFQYRGEVIPSFALQAALLWMRITPGEVKIDIGNAITLPNGRRIPIGFDGTALINPNVTRGARHLRLNELLLAAQQHEKKAPGGAALEDIRDEIVLVQAGGGDSWAAAIATIQSNAFVRRVSWWFDCVFIIVLVLLSTRVRRFSRIDIVLFALAITAAYCMLALALVSSWSIWLPGILPLGATWLVAAFCLFAPRGKNDPDLPSVVPAPPSP